jgi:hypothetical protein
LEQWEINEKKKEYLRRYRSSKRREKNILEEIQRLRMDKMFPSVIYDDMPRAHNHKDLSDYAVVIDEQIQDLKIERLKRAKTYTDIEKKIREMKDDNEQELLRFRYIQGKSFEEIAVYMGYVYGHIIRLHRKALYNISITEED